MNEDWWTAAYEYYEQEAAHHMLRSTNPHLKELEDSGAVIRAIERSYATVEDWREFCY